MKTAISLPDSVFEQAESVAARLGLSRSELYVKALNEYIQRYNKEQILEKLNEFYATEESNLEPGLASLQYAALPYEEW